MGVHVRVVYITSDAHVQNIRCPKQELGFFDLLLAQKELKRPIHIALPPGFEGSETWQFRPLSVIIDGYAGDAVAIPETPDGPPLRVCPTKVKEGAWLTDLKNMTHWVPLREVRESVEPDEYRAKHFKAAFDESRRAVAELLLADNADVYGGPGAKATFVSAEMLSMDARCNEWAELATALRAALGCEPIRVEGDGACCVSSLVAAATNDTVVAEAAKQNMRARVSRRGSALAESELFVNLFVMLEGEDVRDMLSLGASQGSLAVLHEEYGDLIPQAVMNTVSGLSRTITVQGAPLGLAMLRGFKRYENKLKKTKPGWYFLHVGKEPLCEEWAAVLHKTWLSAPRDDELAKQAVIGVVKLGEPVEASSLRDPWALFGWSHPVLAAIEFAEASDQVRGHQGVWHLALQQRVSLSPMFASATYRKFGDSPAAAAQGDVGGAQHSTVVGVIAESESAEEIEEALLAAPDALVPAACSRGGNENSTMLTQTYVNEAFGITFNAVEAVDPSERVDLVCDALETVRQASTEAEFLRAIWPLDFFAGSEDNDKLYDHITEFLNQVKADARTHREISQDPHFTMEKLVPTPYAVATRQVALKNGCHEESFLLAMASNITWLEHHWTRVGADPAPRGVDVVANYIGPSAVKAAEEKAQQRAYKVGGSQAQPEAAPTKRKPIAPSEVSRKRRRVKGIESQPGDAAWNSSSSATPTGSGDASLPASQLPAGVTEAIDEVLETVDPAAIKIGEIRRLVADKLGQSTGSLESEAQRNEFKKLLQTQLQAREAVNAALNAAGEATVTAAAERPWSAVVVVSQHEPSHDTLVTAVHSVHTISAPISVMCMGSPSSHKSWVSDVSKSMMTKSKNAPPAIAEGRVFMVESSAKGIRVCIFSEDRVSAHTDEVVNSFPTPWSEHKQAGTQSHMLCRSKLCTYTQGEQDDIITANGPIHLRGYAFQLKVFGQCVACEWVWRPSPIGWQKRISVAISPDRNPMDEDVADDYSMGLWQRVHDDQLAGPFLHPVYLHLDPYALGGFRTTKRAIADWLEANRDDGVDAYLVVKLEFFYSDVLRFIMFVQRLVQTLERVSSFVTAADRTRANLFEFHAGLHWWKRQVSLHAGFYRFHAQQSKDAKQDDLAAALLNQPPPGRVPKEPLDIVGKLQRCILMNVKFKMDETFSTGTFREWAKCHYKKDATTNNVKLAVDGLLAARLVAEAQAEKKGGPGPKVAWYKKPVWTEIQEDETAQTLCAKLDLTRRYFE